MKNTNLLLLFATILIFSCGKPSNKADSQLPSKAETKSQYDNTSFGVYKGVIIGSSGYVIFRINNGDNTAKGELTIDGRKDILSTTQTITSGQPIVNVKFTGSFSSMTLNAGPDGNNASITDIKIDGHPDDVAGIIFHENSTQQVFSYEGKISGTLSGTINFNRITGNDTTFSVMKFNNDPTVYYGIGYNISTDSVGFNFYNIGSPYYLFEGRWGSNGLSGSWSDEKGINKGTFSSARTY
jgi:hypothetical protein